MNPSPRRALPTLALITTPAGPSPVVAQTKTVEVLAEDDVTAERSQDEANMRRLIDGR